MDLNCIKWSKVVIFWIARQNWKLPVKMMSMTGPRLLAKALYGILIITAHEEYCGIYFPKGDWSSRTFYVPSTEAYEKIDGSWSPVTKGPK